MVLFLATITLRLCRRVLGADDATLGAVMGKRGDVGAVASASVSRHTGLEHRLEGWDQLLKLVEGHAGEIQELQRAGLQLGEP
jgi:hypothetical protein